MRLISSTRLGTRERISVLLTFVTFVIMIHLSKLQHIAA